MPVLSDRYELGRPLGRGGMGEVYEAYDRKLSRRVAVKRVRSELADEHAQERFVREVRHTAAFAHPNVVTVFDVGDESDHPYFVMELVEGRTLAAALAAEGPLPVDEATRIADAVLAGLGAAHARDLVHRDVKPSNVLLGADSSVKLSDFGIAKAVHDAASPLTAAGEVLGTPTYLAPEQTRGEPAGPPADLYAVGVLLYEMLAGAPPFHGDTPLATALAHCDAPVPALGERREGLAPQLVGVVERALEKHPEQRFPDADAMRAALASAAAPAAGAEGTVPGVVSTTRALPAVPPPPPARPSAPVRRPDRPRRRAAPVLVALGILAALTVGAALALRGSGTPDVSGAAAEAGVVATDPTVASTTTTVPTPTSAGELLTVLANNPLAYGPRGPELADGLAEVISGDDESAAEALRLAAEIPGWVATGELDQEIGALAQRMLVPFIAIDPANRDEGGNGKGKGRGSGGDEGGDD